MIGPAILIFFFGFVCFQIGERNGHPLAGWFVGGLIGFLVVVLIKYEEYLIGEDDE